MSLKLPNRFEIDMTAAPTGEHAELTNELGDKSLVGFTDKRFQLEVLNYGKPVLRIHGCQVDILTPGIDALREMIDAANEALTLREDVARLRAEYDKLSDDYVELKEKYGAARMGEDW